MKNSGEKHVIDTLFNKEQEKLVTNYIINIENEINYNFPKDYKKYLFEISSLKLEKNTLTLQNGVKKVVRYLYSMNPNSKTYILKFQQFDSELDKKLVPFAELEFGDLLCFERKTNNVVYYNHELDTFEYICDNWSELFNKLHSEK